MWTQEDIKGALSGTPFLVEDDAAAGMAAALNELGDRVTALRSDGRMTEETLRRYYGDRRFEQVAESNAIEGSTLSIGETELAVAKGITLTGHDPAYVRDAIALDKALRRLTELAAVDAPTDLTQLHELHGLILEGNPKAGLFRDSPVRISGSEHRPPKTWPEVMSAMEAWEKWSSTSIAVAPVLRASILHAWLAHVHPYVDGNGRTARAVQNLELVRAGYPPIIVRKVQDRDRYVDGLQRADQGDLASFLELVVDRTRAALTGLESAARQMQGYDPQLARLRKVQQSRLDVWNRAIELLHSTIVERLVRVVVPAGGQVRTQRPNDGLGLDEYIELCSNRPVSRSWSFKIEVLVPAVGSLERLAWTGFRSEAMKRGIGSSDSTPSLFWSRRNPKGYPPWIRVGTGDGPGIAEMTIDPNRGDEWHAMRDSQTSRHSTSQLATLIADDLLQALHLPRGVPP